MALGNKASLLAIVFALAACGAPTPSLTPSSPMALTIDPGIRNLRVHFDQNGRLSFSHQEGWRRQRFQMPYHLQRNDDQTITWRRADQTTLEIGRVVDGRVTLCQGEYDAVCDLAFSVRHPNDDNDGPAAVYSIELRSKTDVGLTSATPTGRRSQNQDLINWLIPSPNQLDAGSCLYMASTGAMEILLNRQLGSNTGIAGDHDLSERYLMNSAPSQNWLTDAVLGFNRGSYLSEQYPFRSSYLKINAKDNFVTDRSGRYIEVSADTENARLSAKVNWNNDLSQVRNRKVQLPNLKRKILFADPAANRWNVGIVKPEVIDAVKAELDSQRPVISVYNHYGIWHAVVIVGYDDQKSTDCYMTRDFKDYMKQQGDTQGYIEKINQWQAKTGACRDQGVFYVRDSIQKSEMQYDYGAHKGFYSKPYVERSYDWLRFLGNHVYSVDIGR